MSKDTDNLEKDFGETTLTSKGQVTLPGALRQAFHLDAGGRLRFRRRVDSVIVVEPRKRRGILDIARANPIRLPAGIDMDAAIDASISEAVADRERRSRGTPGE
jgi:AbrB family looped-hinge helix DNA binding protein